jgi:hypothetical protein
MAPVLAENGVALFAISYDSVAILKDFVATHGITYPLLSDEGSRAMRGLGLINERVQEDHAAYGIPPNPRHVNLPYPGVFALDAAGVVTDKRFYESYRERETGVGLISQALGIVTRPTAPVVAASEPVVTARAWLDSPTYVFFQRLALTLEISIAPGFHVCGQSAGAALTPLSVEIDPIPGLEVGPARWPAPRRFADGRWIHDGVVPATMALTFAAAPGGGDHVLGITVRYQACDDAACLAPGSVRLEVPVREAALVGRALPGPTSPR